VPPSIRKARRPPAAGLPPELEEDFQRWCIETAHLFKWHVVAYRAARVGRHGRWVTPLQGDSGAPDLILARGGVCMLRELKRDGEYPRANQRDWLRELGEHGGVWRPSDRVLIVEELRTGTKIIGR